MRLAQRRRRRDPAALLDRRQHGARPRLLQIRERDARRGRRREPSGAGAAARRLGRSWLVTTCHCGFWRGRREQRRPARARSNRNATDSRARSAAGRVTFTSASSSGRRGSPPWRMSSTATASRSINRSTVASPIWFAWASSRSRRLLGHGHRGGNLAEMLDEHELAQVLEQVHDEPAEVVPALRQLLDERERAGGVAVDHEVAEREERLLLDRAEQLEHRLHRDVVAGGGRRAGRASTRRRGTRRGRRARRARAPGRGPRCPRRRRSRASFCTRSCSRGRWKTNVWQRDRTVGSTFDEIGRAEDEDEVRRRLLDELQQRVPRGVGELVRLVEDVDLVAALRPAAGRPGRGSRGCRRCPAATRRPSRRRRATCRRRSPGRRGMCRRAWSSALRAVEALREDARHRGLPGPARPGEEIRLAHGVAGDRVAQRPHNRLLPDDVRERLRTVFPVESGH